MLTRDQHFERLNSYADSREYVEYALTIGIEVSGRDLPSLLGKRWEISEHVYKEFLNLLPPLNWRGSSFLMREFCFGSVTTKYSMSAGRYYCEFVDVKKEPNP